MRRVASVIVALALLSGRASAHEIGKTQVTATFLPSGTYQIDIVADPDALLTKLAVFAGEPLPGALNRAERDRHLAASSRVYLKSGQPRVRPGFPTTRRV